MKNKFVTKYLCLSLASTMLLSAWPTCIGAEEDSFTSTEPQDLEGEEGFSGEAQSEETVQNPLPEDTGGEGTVPEDPEPQETIPEESSDSQEPAESSQGTDLSDPTEPSQGTDSTDAEVPQPVITQEPTDSQDNISDTTPSEGDGTDITEYVPTIPPTPTPVVAEPGSTEPLPSPADTPSPAPTQEPEPTPGEDPTPEPTATPTPTITVSPIPTPDMTSLTSTPTPTATPTPTPTATPTPTPVPTGIQGITTMVSNLHAGKEFYLNSLKKVYGLEFSEDFAKVMDEIEEEAKKEKGLEENTSEGLLVRDWQDILAVYVYEKSKEGKESFVLDKEAKGDLKRIFAEMDPVVETEENAAFANYHINTYIREHDIPKEDRTILKKYTETDCKLLCATVTAAKGFVRQSVGDYVSEERIEVISAAYSLIGKVGYFWGGKSDAVGENPSWGTVETVTAEGSNSTGTLRAYGLDCSGFVSWAVINGYEDEAMVSQVGTGTSEQWEKAKVVAEADAQPGDFVFQKGPEAGSDNHVGILVGKTDAGDWIAVHCSSSQNGVTVGEAYTASFRYIREPSFYPEKEEVKEEERVILENVDDIVVPADVQTEEPQEFGGSDTATEAADDEVIVLVEDEDQTSSEDEQDLVILEEETLPEDGSDLMVIEEEPAPSPADEMQDLVVIEDAPASGEETQDSVAIEEEPAPAPIEIQDVVILEDEPVPTEEGQDEITAEEAKPAEEEIAQVVVLDAFDASEDEEEIQIPAIIPTEDDLEEPPAFDEFDSEGIESSSPEAKSDTGFNGTLSIEEAGQEQEEEVIEIAVLDEADMEDAAQTLVTFAQVELVDFFSSEEFTQPQSQEAPAALTEDLPQRMTEDAAEPIVQAEAFGSGLPDIVPVGHVETAVDPADEEVYDLMDVAVIDLFTSGEFEDDQLPTMLPLETSLAVQEAQENSLLETEEFLGRIDHQASPVSEEDFGDLEEEEEETLLLLADVDVLDLFSSEEFGDFSSGN